MTAVLFKFTKPDGTPVADAPFRVTTRKPSFDETLHNGIQVPGDVDGVTDAQGEATLTLVAGFATYYLLMDNPDVVSDSDGCIAGLRYRFMVPESSVPVRIEDLIVTSPTFSRPWDETALQIIIDAKAASQASAVAAAGSASAAEDSAQRAEAAIDITAASADAAAESARLAGLSEVAAGTSASDTLAFRNEAEGFRDQARTSELAAAGSATEAGNSAAAAADRVVESQTYADESKLARDAAIAAQGAAAQSATETAADVLTTANNVTATEQNKAATAADVVTVTGLKDQAGVFKDQAEVAAQRAEDALGSITGVIADGGPIDLSGGVYPAKPNVSTVWRVTVGGTVTSTPEGTITYFEGDQLNYTKDQDIFYRTATAVRVSSVAGRTGDVVLAKADVGLPLADNTPDTDKPISTAQQAAFAARTPTVGRQDTTAGRLIKVGDYGENGGGAIVMSSDKDANDIVIGGTYVFNGGGLNLPSGSWYLKHFNHAVANYCKQVIYGLVNDEAWTRTNNNGVWSTWTRLVGIVDNLTSADPTKALSARQGKALLEMLQNNNATIVRYTYNLAAGQTTITGNSLEGTPLAYTPGVPFMVEKDGFPLWIGSDYTAANGSSITLTQTLALASQFAITVFGAFSAADHYTKAQSDFRYYQKSETFTQAEINAKLATVAANAAEAVGTVKWVPARLMIPDGAFPMDGGLYSRTTYPDMWALIRDGKVPKATDALWLSDVTNRGSFTEGDGSTNFRVPDYNGKYAGSLQAVFIRGDGSNALAAGVIQRDALQGHVHTYQGATTAGGATTTLARGGAENTGVIFNSTAPITDPSAVYGGARVAPETRSVNVAGVWTIRLFGSVSNVGNVDVAQLAANLGTVSNKVGVLETANQKVYMTRQIGNEHINPQGANTYIHWGVEVIAKGCTYNGVGGGRGIVVPVGGVYRVSFTGLSLSTLGPCGLSLQAWRAGVQLPTLGYAYGGTTSGAEALTCHWLGRLQANDQLKTMIEAGGLLNSNNGGQYNSFIVERIDD